MQQIKTNVARLSNMYLHGEFHVLCIAHPASTALSSCIVGHCSQINLYDSDGFGSDHFAVEDSMIDIDSISPLGWKGKVVGTSGKKKWLQHWRT